MTLVSPFPKDKLFAVWLWLHEFPECNFDDSSVKTLEEFMAEMEVRLTVERTWAAFHEDKLCGVIAYLPQTERLGCFHGICFTREVHGKGVANAAVRQVLDELFASGVEKVQAAYFAENLRVRRFLAGLGAEDEGILCKQTVRGGIPIDMRLVAFFKDCFNPRP